MPKLRGDNEIQQGKEVIEGKDYKGNQKTYCYARGRWTIRQS